MTGAAGRVGAVVLTLSAFAACSSRGAELASNRVIAAPLVTPSPAPTDTPTPDPTAAAPATLLPTLAPKPQATTPVTAPTPKAVPSTDAYAAFRKLGSWIDVFDTTNDPATIVPLVRSMASKGVKTLYLETARYSSASDVQFPDAAGAALDAAKAKGMRVVAWYPPSFDDLGRDVRRSVAAMKFRSPGGNRFDAFAADIEYKVAVPDHAERSKRAVEYSKRIRKESGSMPLAAIVIPPTSLELNENRWPGFPWQSLAPYYKVFMPMNYWTGRSADPKTADELTRENVAEVKRLTGKQVHIIGSAGPEADGASVGAYVAAAKAAGSLGGGLYDFRTTRNDVWDELRKLNP